jgi:hypothetical protein
MLELVFQLFTANHTKELYGNTHVRIYVVAFCIYIGQHKCVKWVCTVRKVTGMWYTVQELKYFKLLSTSGRQSPRADEMNILKEKLFLVLNIFWIIEPSKTRLKHILNYWTK